MTLADDFLRSCAKAIVPPGGTDSHLRGATFFFHKQPPGMFLLKIISVRLPRAHFVVHGVDWIGRYQGDSPCMAGSSEVCITRLVVADLVRREYKTASLPNGKSVAESSCRAQFFEVDHKNAAGVVTLEGYLHRR
jgi:hypothetical protein